jgi:cyclopropane fatty-acyl-phospholipid synthase-like methyltransferase
MPTIAEQQAYYNTRWAKHGFINSIEMARGIEVMRLLAHVRAGMKTAPRICDLGCGTGWLTAMAGNVGPALGLDLSDVTEHRARYPYCEFLTADAVEWKPEPESFDVVLSVEVIEHIEHPRKIDYIAVARQALRRGGYLILTTPNRRTMEAIAGGGRAWSNQPIEDWLRAGELRELLTSSGFRMESLTSILPGIATRGMYRIANSAKVNRLLQLVGFHKLWTALLLRAYFGLHLVALARRID